MRYSRFAFSAIALTLLCGCPTAAQRQFQAIKTTNQQTATQAKACVAVVHNSPEYAPLRVHLPSDSSAPTLQQLSDSTFATPTDVAAVYSTHPQMKECRRAILAGLAQSEPSVVPILIGSFNKGDDDRLAVVQRKLAWGEYVRRIRDRAVESKSQIQDAEQHIVAELKKENAAEMAQRQRAAEALAAWA